MFNITDYQSYVSDTSTLHYPTKYPNFININILSMKLKFIGLQLHTYKRSQMKFFIFWRVSKYFCQYVCVYVKMYVKNYLSYDNNLTDGYNFGTMLNLEYQTDQGLSYVHVTWPYGPGQSQWPDGDGLIKRDWIDHCWLQHWIRCWQIVGNMLELIINWLCWYQLLLIKFWFPQYLCSVIVTEDPKILLIFTIGGAVWSTCGSYDKHNFWGQKI